VYIAAKRIAQLRQSCGERAGEVLGLGAELHERIRRRARAHRRLVRQLRRDALELERDADQLRASMQRARRRGGAAAVRRQLAAFRREAIALGTRLQLLEQRARLLRAEAEQSRSFEQLVVSRPLGSVTLVFFVTIIFSMHRLRWVEREIGGDLNRKSDIRLR
jgi:hypothetical protein